MGPVEDHDIIYRGDDYDSRPYTLQDRNGNVYDASTSTWAVKLRETEDNSTTLATGTVDVTDAATGVLIVRFTDTDTAALTVTRAVWDLEETTAAGGKDTWVKCLCTVEKDVTR